MHSHLMEQASKKITDPLILVNVVSKRVRQLIRGQRPMVERGLRNDLAEIALREIIEGKVTVELAKTDGKA